MIFYGTDEADEEESTAREVYSRLPSEDKRKNCMNRYLVGVCVLQEVFTAPACIL